MRSIYCLLLVLLAGCTGRHPVLLHIVHNGKTGFINPQGEVVIKPKFLNAREFSEGLAAVRLEGYFGYINTSGDFAIHPRFDYALAFKDGYAMVNTEGEWFYINRDGERAFNKAFIPAGAFENGRTIVKTSSGKFGVIDAAGKLVVDTAFSEIKPGAPGTYIVYGLDHIDYYRPDTPYNYKVGIVDATGKFLVPFGVYAAISYDEGTFGVDSILKEDVSVYGASSAFLDQSCKHIVGKARTEHSCLNGGIRDGLIVMSFRDSNNIYQGYMDLKGNIILQNKQYKTAYDFNNGRAFVEDERQKYYIVDKKGQLVSTQGFDEVLHEQFRDNVAFVRIGEKWGLVDTNGKFIVPPSFAFIPATGVFKDYFIFSSGPDYMPDNLYGIADLKGKIIMPAKFQEVDAAGYQHGLLKVKEDDRYGYIDKKGKYVWREATKTAGPDTLDIDYMSRGYYSAGSLPREDFLYNGWSLSPNMPVKITPRNRFGAGNFAIVIRLRDTCRWNMDFAGASLYVFNTTKDTIRFEAQDSRLSLKMQALNKKLQWRDIEYLPSSWCGNSYHEVELPPGYYWSFCMPLYKGELKTQLRAALEYIDPRSGEIITLYSTPFNGSVNPAQFWRKEGHTPTNIMDPYNE